MPPVNLPDDISVNTDPHCLRKIFALPVKEFESTRKERLRVINEESPAIPAAFSDPLRKLNLPAAEDAGDDAGIHGLQCLYFIT